MVSSTASYFTNNEGCSKVFAFIILLLIAFIAFGIYDAVIYSQNKHENDPVFIPFGIYCLIILGILFIAFVITVICFIQQQKCFWQHPDRNIDVPNEVPTQVNSGA